MSNHPQQGSEQPTIGSSHRGSRAAACAPPRDLAATPLRLSDFPAPPLRLASRARQAALVNPPWQTASHREQTGGRPHELSGISHLEVRAARRCSSSDLVTPSRATVTRRAAVGRGRGALATRALTVDPAHNLPRSAGFAARLSTDPASPTTGAARPADLLAVVSAPTLADFTGTATNLPPLAHSALPTEAGRWAGRSGGEGCLQLIGTSTDFDHTTTPTKENR